MNEKARVVSVVDTYMRLLRDFTPGPGVFRVYVEATDHSTDFRAVAEMRGERTSFVARGDSPEEALKILHGQLVRSYEPCQSCGGTGLEYGGAT